METMVEFLSALRTALQEDNSVLYFDGCRGAGQIVALVMALCPEDSVIMAEDEVISQGGRSNVIVSIRAQSKESSFALETCSLPGLAICLLVVCL